MKSFSDDIKWDELRNRALQILNTKKVESNPIVPDETVKLIQELDIYRIGLELENSRLSMAKDQIEKTQKEYMDLFNLVPTGLIELSTGGLIIKINLKGATLLGSDISSLIHSPFDVFITDNSKIVFDEFLRSVIKEEGISQSVEINLFINQKKLKEVEISGVYNESTGSIILSLQDITRHKKTEEHLVRSKERAETADRHKSSFLSTMSHEIRAPLNSIIGFSGILLQEIPGNLNEEQKKQVGMIQTSGRHLLTLINDLLDLSKIEAGQLNINIETFNLPDVIEDVIQLEWPMARDKHLLLETKVSPEVGLIRSDKQRVHQILLNLVNNAIKFTEKGSVTLRSDIENNWVKIEVEDTGIGIKDEDLEKIFDPFIQVENDLTKSQQGSGLGLPVTKKFTELLQGKIEVQSRLGEGSKFIILLPR